MDIQKKMFK